MAAASNTRECILEFRGKRVCGVMTGMFPLSRGDIASGTQTIIFDDRTALTFKGAFWAETRENVDRAIKRLANDLDETQQLQRDLLVAAGDKD